MTQRTDIPPIFFDPQNKMRVNINKLNELYPSNTNKNHCKFEEIKSFYDKNGQLQEYRIFTESTLNYLISEAKYRQTKLNNKRIRQKKQRENERKVIKYCKNHLGITTDNIKQENQSFISIKRLEYILSNVNTKDYSPQEKEKLKIIVTQFRNKLYKE